MDFSSIKKALSSWVDSVKKTAKKVSNKTLSFANEQVSRTGLFLTEREDYEKMIAEKKRFIVIAYDETDLIGRELVLLLSVWMTKTFIDGSTLRYISIDPDDTPDFAHDLKLNWPVEMRVFYDGRETNRFTDLDDIKEWWDWERIYKVKFVPRKKNEPKKQTPKKSKTSTTKKAGSATAKKTSTSKTTATKRTKKPSTKTKPKTTRKTRTRKADSVAPVDPLAEATKK